ncbi:hypothetical protein [Neorhizobium galegae]|uniref:hypothetical protein n=1 Tax=Neorhizobium galegae TaxID=399 RepID=UPI0021045A90|nr:hypothetical protein [Neorhizobium galegae]MCQ1855587.1 hypothetical protein [Neorhizobium galegae]
MGEFEGDTPEAAVHAYAQAAGYGGIAGIADFLGKSEEAVIGELSVDDVTEFATGSTAESSLGNSVVTVQSIDWFHEDTYTMIVAKITIDDVRYEAAEYYDAAEDCICTDADAHLTVNGICDLQTGEMLKIFYVGQEPLEELFWTDVEEQIIGAMRAFVNEQPTNLAA